MRESVAGNTCIEGQGEVIINVNFDVCVDASGASNSLEFTNSDLKNRTLSEQEAAFFYESGSESHSDVSVTIPDYLLASSFNGYREDFDFSDINPKLLCKSVSETSSLASSEGLYKSRDTFLFTEELEFDDNLYDATFTSNEAYGNVEISRESACTVGNEYKTLPDKSASISCGHKLPSYSLHPLTVLDVEDEMGAEQSINADATELKRTCDIANLETWEVWEFAKGEKKERHKHKRSHSNLAHRRTRSLPNVSSSWLSRSHDECIKDRQGRLDSYNNRHHGTDTSKTVSLPSPRCEKSFNFSRSCDVSPHYRPIKKSHEGIHTLSGDRLRVPSQSGLKSSRRRNDSLHSQPGTTDMNENEISWSQKSLQKQMINSYDAHVTNREEPLIIVTDDAKSKPESFELWEVKESSSESSVFDEEFGHPFSERRDSERDDEYGLPLLGYQNFYVYHSDSDLVCALKYDSSVELDRRKSKSACTIHWEDSTVSDDSNSGACLSKPDSELSSKVYSCSGLHSQLSKLQDHVHPVASENETDKDNYGEKHTDICDNQNISGTTSSVVCPQCGSCVEAKSNPQSPRRISVSNTDQDDEFILVYYPTPSDSRSVNSGQNSYDSYVNASSNIVSVNSNTLPNCSDKISLSLDSNAGKNIVLLEKPNLPVPVSSSTPVKDSDYLRTQNDVDRNDSNGSSRPCVVHRSGNLDEESPASSNHDDNDSCSFVDSVSGFSNDTGIEVDTELLSISENPDDSELAERIERDFGGFVRTENVKSFDSDCDYNDNCTRVDTEASDFSNKKDNMRDSTDASTLDGLTEFTESFDSTVTSDNHSANESLASETLTSVSTSSGNSSTELTISTGNHVLSKKFFSIASISVSPKPQVHDIEATPPKPQAHNIKVTPPKSQVYNIKVTPPKPQVYNINLTSPKPQTRNITATPTKPQAHDIEVTLLRLMTDSSDHIQAQDRPSVTKLLPLLSDPEAVAFLLTKIAALRESKEKILEIADFVYRTTLYQLEISFSLVINWLLVYMGLIKSEKRVDPIPDVDCLLSLLEHMIAQELLSLHDARMLAFFICKDHTILLSWRTECLSLLQTCFKEELKEFDQNTHSCRCEALVRILSTICTYFGKLSLDTAFETADNFLRANLNLVDRFEFVNSILIYLGLLKSETPSDIIFDIKTFLKVLDHVVKQTYFPTDVLFILRAFLVKPNERLASCRLERNDLIKTIADL